MTVDAISNVLVRLVYPELSETPAVEMLHCLSSPAPDRTTAEPSGIYHIGQSTRERCSDTLIGAIKTLGDSLRAA
ncbi:MAG: hypothetical protein OEQ14_18815 [Gammaproteobacteria bacterium]|nr:hypothetical protein [Gammaproteobacteria bacterium]